MASGRRQVTIAGIMSATAAVALVLAFPHYAGEPWVWVVLFAGPWLLPWIRVPMALRRDNWQPIDYGHRPFDPSGPDIPDEIAARFRRATADLQALGFALRGGFRQSNPASQGIAQHLGLFERPGTWEVAKLMVVTTNRGVRTTIVFQTFFADGTELATSDGGELPAWPRRADALGLAFPEIRSTGDLFEAHRAMVARAGRIPARDLPADDAALVDHLRATIEKNRAWPVAIGFYVLDEARGVYRLTWKGAIWNAWGRLPPVGPIRRALRRRRARQTLRELGLEDRPATTAVGPSP